MFQGRAYIHTPVFSTHTLLDCRCRFVGLSCRMREAVVSSASSRTLRFFVCHTKCVRHINAVACGNKRTPAVTLTSACNNNNIPACCCAEASSPVQRCWLWSNHEYCSNPMFQREKVYWRCIILCSMHTIQPSTRKSVRPSSHACARNHSSCAPQGSQVP